MSDTPTKRESPGVMAWRTVYTLGLGLLGVLSLFVLDVVKDTSKGVNDLQIKLGVLTGTTTTRLDGHDRRLDSLETWRHTRAQP